MFGDGGNDTLFGGNGNDKFVFKPGDGTDIIINYSAGDSIVFDAIDGITAGSITLVDGTGANNGSLLINLISTGETLAILQTTSVAEFNSIGLIEVVEI
ncbi:hemolysin-type calcium-binding repeat family protein [Lyngbya aestuarii BL J]|uniref:Hemolysin-type calcium-binding repeat family protein n=1 Tax=Lyngbya aestuarii BL J TaxID=1348334 RepID=U7QAD9_9CYAN|nr:hemolysin-type calcium-binding repeat family protein [Lyngbya aestuarii]ERT03731.1 hemolysin-type calcium-binding repeat family protein [Lyngbya aestuarii BL J]ERT05360.1 hemolysin-type calcium-binding repeat family protein [Lyngbya aestuarii BL J]